MNLKKVSLVGIFIGIGLAVFGLIFIVIGSGNSALGVLLAGCGMVLFFLCDALYLVDHFAKKRSGNTESVKSSGPRIPLLGMPKTVVQIIAATIGFLIALAIAALFDGSTFGCALGVAVIAACLVFVDKLYDKMDALQNKYIQFHKNEFAATLVQRSEISASFLQIDQVRMSLTEYNPEEWVYTGATVGGVHMGGFHKNEAYLSSMDQGASGKYRILVKLNGKNMRRDIMFVDRIILSESLVDEAKNDERVAKFLKGSELVLKYDGADTNLTTVERMALAQAQQNKDDASLYNLMQRSMIAKALTLEDCKNVVAWVSGE